MNREIERAVPQALAAACGRAERLYNSVDILQAVTLLRPPASLTEGERR